MLRLSTELIKLDLWPFLDFRLEFVASSFSRILCLLLLLLPGFDLLLLRGLPLLHILPIGYGFGKRLVEEATLVDKWHGHEGAESGHALVVHAWLTNYFFDVNMLETLMQAQLLPFFSAIFILSHMHFIQSSVLMAENIMRYTDIWL